MKCFHFQKKKREREKNKKLFCNNAYERKERKEKEENR